MLTVSSATSSSFGGAIVGGGIPHQGRRRGLDAHRVQLLHGRDHRHRGDLEGRWAGPAGKHHQQRGGGF
jgi:hypothetical protein